MIYYDIHTHQPAVDPEDVAIVNRIIGKDQEEISFPGQWCSVGIHPWYINNVQEQLSRLESVALSPSVVAIGEAGLDKLTETSLKIQQDIFLEQAALAERVGKPLVIHCVKAWSELVAARKSVKPHIPWVIHGFRGNAELALQLTRQGFYLSFGEYFNLQALQVAWDGCLFAETDEKEVDIRSVYRRIASSLQISLEELAVILEKNMQNVFPFVR